MNEQELQQTKLKLKQHRVRQNFNKKYQQRGGIEQLQRMVNNDDTLDDMAKWFGITSSRLSVILSDVLGMPYSVYLAGKKISRSGVAKHGV